VQKASQDASLAKKSLLRAKNLYADRVIPQKDLAQAETDYAKSNADVASASARLASLDIATQGGMVAGIRAQIDGTVVDRSVLVGQEVRADATQPMFTITDLGTVWVVADVYEQDLALVQPDVDVQVTVSAYPGEEFPGRVAVVAHVIDPNTHTVKVRCVVPNGDHRLKPEMFARVVLHDPGAKALSVSARAILAETQPPHVVVVDGEHYHLREVQVGPEVDGKVRVVSGLKPGERVVTDGAIFLKQEIQSH
jgi:cobalt-zinc-cadmium efflux system membrane fusion protein